MKNLLFRVWKEEDGVLTFEWVLLVTLLTIGVVGGIAGVRDAIIDELGDVAQAMLSLDQSYIILPPLVFEVHDTQHSTAAGSSFLDAALFTDCTRSDAPPQQLDPSGGSDAPS